MKWCCRKALTSSLFFLLLLGCALFWLRHASAAPSVQQKPPETIPVWVYDAESFAFWRDAQGNYQGLYPRLAAMLHERYGYNVQIRPIDAEEMDRRFANDDYGLYAGVIRTDDLARNRILSSRLFDNEVVAASNTQRIYKPEDLHNSRVLFLRDDAIQDRVQQRYPNLKFRELRQVENGEEAFRLLSDGQADFYINDASEMDNTARYYQLSRPFPGLRITRVFAFSPALHTMRNDINQLINDEYRSGKLRQLILDNKRQFLLSRVTISDTERHWLAQNKLDVWLPANENYAPLIWHDRQGYHGSAIDMINDMRDLLHVDVNVHYIDNYYEALQSQNWPVRLVNVIAPPDRSQLPGMIGPVVSWHNVYYNRIGQPFIWDEDQIRHQRIGVIKGSFSQFYLQQRYASEITLVTFGTIEQLISGIEDDRVDYILGDLSSLESALRGNELFRGVLKVAGITRSELQMGAWADSAHPLHNLLSQVHRLSGYRTLSEGTDEPTHFSGLTRNTLKIISVLLLITAIFSLCLLVIMWRHMRQNRIVNRNIVKVLEKVNRAHDDETGSHIQRVAKYCGLLGRALKLPRRTVRDIENFASLHDVGKIAVPERILRKEGPLTEDEFEEMKLHTLKGWRIIQGLSLGPVAENIIHFHHEKWDGSGYPDGLRGEQIPLEARILALADVYDALRQKRIYKPSFTHEQAMQIIEAGSGRHFDPRLVALFRQQQHLFARIFDTLAD